MFYTGPRAAITSSSQCTVLQLSAVLSLLLDHLNKTQHAEYCGFKMLTFKSITLLNLNWSICCVEAKEQLSAVQSILQSKEKTDAMD